MIILIKKKIQLAVTFFTKSTLKVKALLERVVSTKAALAKLKHLDIEYNMIETVDQQLIEDAGLKLDKFYFTLNYTDMDEQSFFDNHDEEEEEWDDEDDQYWSFLADSQLFPVHLYSF